MYKEKEIYEYELDQDGRKVESIDFLGLSSRSYNILIHNRINSLQKLLALTDRDIKSFRTAGEACLKEIKEKIALYKSGDLKPPPKENKLVNIDPYETTKVLGLSRRSYNVLGRNGITTIQKLSTLTDKDLRSIRGIGEGCFREIKEKLALYESGELEPPLKQVTRFDKNPYMKRNK